MAVHKEQLIHYFNEKSQEVDHVLDVFIRTNSGGTKLAFRIFNVYCCRELGWGLQKRN
jgi:hypothetical protein